MKKLNECPCLTCQRVTAAEDCENKQCRQWANWFLSRWEQIHGYYEKYAQEEKK